LRTLKRTYAAADGAEVGPHADSLDTLSANQMRRQPFGGAFPTAEAPGDVTHVDVFHVSMHDLPQVARSRRAKMYRYAMVMVDAYSRRLMLYGLQGLTDEEIGQCFQWYSQQLGVATMAGTRWSLGPGALQHFQTDGGTSLVSRRVEYILGRLGYGATVTSAAYTPQHNGIAESAVRYVKQRLAAVMTAGGVPAQLWYFAAMAIVAGHNKLATQQVYTADGRIQYVSPHQLFTGRRPDLKHQVVVGTPCRVLRLAPRSYREPEFAVRGRMGKVLCWAGDGVQWDGTWQQKLGWVCLLADGTLECSREVRFNEMSIIQGGHAPEFLTVGDDDSKAEEEVGDTAEIADVEAATLCDENFGDEVPALIDDDSDDGGEADVERSQSSADPLEKAENAQGSVQPQLSKELRSKQGQKQQSSEEPKSKQGQGPQLRRADLKAAGRQLDQGYDPQRADRSRRSDSQAKLFGSLAATAEVLEERLRAADVKVPRSHEQAMRSDHSKQWNEAEQDHIESHMVRGTWVEVIVPEGTRTLPTHWVYQVKQDSDGYVDRFKARTVLGGNKQIPGVDCQETFSPTMRGEQMRLLFAVAAELQADAQRLAGADISVLHVADVKNAYLQSLLEEDEQPLHDLPKGYQPKLTAQQGFKVVGRSVYAHPGLKQAGRAWYRTQREQLLARGFEEYAGATCIFVKRLGEGEFIVVGIFV
ncbi:MAG: hypothetical protein EBU85_06860, partial [Actinobacteria bacterium]|nr:hypothetical protein [Actinomycetota bacterium]